MLNLICEIGVNHENCVETAISMVESIGKYQFSDVRLTAKFQIYNSFELAAENSPSYWDLNYEKTSTQRELFANYDKLTFEDYVRIYKACQSSGVEFLITAFDLVTLKSYDPLVERHKLASADILNVPLIRAISETRKPILASTGAASFSDIDFLLETLSPSSLRTLSLLHCVLNYPTMDHNANLNGINVLRQRYPQFRIGYSDHTIPNSELSILSIALSMGVDLIEKHFTHDKSLRGNDHYHSIDHADIPTLISHYHRIRTALGNPDLFERFRQNEAQAITHARRSIVSSKHLKRGTVLTSSNITTKRPGTGISSRYWDQVIGLTVAKDIPADTIIMASDLNHFYADGSFGF